MAKKDDVLPVAVATHGGFLATLIVLLAGTMNGTRAYMLLLRAAMAFLLVSGSLKLIVAAAMQFIRLNADQQKNADSETEDLQETADLISSAAQSTDPMEKVAT
ncbi:MAG: hypothetical protein HKN12_02750 [Gemmatimonadetes bacterium]|nr:hypothetical protein [Gemmatimonadota bacterium]